MTHDTRRSGTTIPHLLVVGACAVTVINAGLSAWLGLGPLFVAVCGIIGTGGGILWFAASALCLLTSFMLSQYLAIRTVVAIVASVAAFLQARRSAAA